jgi:antitoxin component YwqK of YwqJK toxin-antitoxin module
MPETTTQPVAQPEKVLIKNEDGMVTEEAMMLGGVLEGETILYNHGRVAARLFFKNGKQEGEGVYYDDIGQLQMKSNYVAGKRHGESTYYDQTGKVVRKENYEAGQLHGRMTDFFLNGKAREVYHYQQGLKHGESLRFDIEGKLQERVCFHKGKLVRCPPIR